MAHYALLGATPAPESTIDLAMTAVDPTHNAGLPSGVHVGLPDEYRPGVEHAFALAMLTPIKIVLAAHHDVDSAVVRVLRHDEGCCLRSWPMAGH